MTARTGRRARPPSAAGRTALPGCLLRLPVLRLPPCFPGPPSGVFQVSSASSRLPAAHMNAVMPAWRRRGHGTPSATISS